MTPHVDERAAVGEILRDHVESRRGGDEGTSGKQRFLPGLGIAIVVTGVVAVPFNVIIGAGVTALANFWGW